MLAICDEQTRCQHAVALQLAEQQQQLQVQVAPHIQLLYQNAAVSAAEAFLCFCCPPSIAPPRSCGGGGGGGGDCAGRGGVGGGGGSEPPEMPPPDAPAPSDDILTADVGACFERGNLSFHFETAEELWKSESKSDKDPHCRFLRDT